MVANTNAVPQIDKEKRTVAYTLLSDPALASTRAASTSREHPDGGRGGGVASCASSRALLRRIQDQSAAPVTVLLLRRT